MTRQAVILAGGLGTRLRAVTGGLPKALAPVGDTAVLGHQLALCRRHGFDDVLLLLGHGAEAVQDYVGDGSRFGLRVRSVVEKQPLGSAGAVLAVLDQLAERFLVLYCDTMLDIDLERLWNFHEERSSGITLLVHPNDHPFDSDLVETDSADQVLRFSRWHADGPLVRNLVSAALYVIERDCLRPVIGAAGDGVRDFGRDIFPALLQLGVPITAYRSVEYIKDMGTPERLQRVNRDLTIGKVDPERSGRRRASVFLDRDGTLNVERQGILDPAAIALLPGAVEGVALFNKAGLPAVVVTNQPYVSHGTLAESTLEQVHAALERDLAVGHAYVDAIYYCPHHPHRGYAGERPELKIDCDCRKPKPGMLIRAAEALHLDLAESWMIGDQTADIEAAVRAGVRAVLVRTGHGGRDGKYARTPDYVFDDVGAAAHFIVDCYPALRRRAEELAKELTTDSVVLIGGAASSGKSTWATILAEAATNRGLSPRVLHLDDWRQDDSDIPTTPGNGYDLDDAQEIITNLMATPDEIVVNLPVYDVAERRRTGRRDLRFGVGGPLIIEGRVACALCVADARRCTVTTPDETRRKRYFSKGRALGLSDVDIKQRWLDDEIATAGTADQPSTKTEPLTGSGEVLA